MLPDNVLFEDGDGQKIRRDLMDKCNLHTILRLPTGIFYAAGVKTNVLFFTRGITETENTKGVWYFDMRTNVPNYGKRTPLTRAAFNEFIEAYTGGVQPEKLTTDFDGTINEIARKKVGNECWQYIDRANISTKNDSLDLGLIADDSFNNGDDLGEPIDIAKEALTELETITKQLQAMIKELG